MSADTTISVAEFLEFEFYFELAQFLRIQTRDLNRYKQLYPVEFAQCARHVLLTSAQNSADVTSSTRKTRYDRLPRPASRSFGLSDMAVPRTTAK